MSGALQQSFLMQLVLPTHNNAGEAFADQIWEDLKTRLVDKFGGVTAFRRSPAQGVWSPTPDRRASEDVFMVEVMTDALDVAWWAALQQEFEASLDQEHIIIRAIQVAEIVQT